MEMRAVMLGTGTPNADPERSGPSVAIVRGQSAYIVDAGPGVVRRASAAARAGTDALRMPRLHIVFLTHLHSDHTLGLPDLIFSPWVLGRKDPLEVYGPPGTKAMVDHLLAAYVEDIRNRTEGLEHGNTTGYKVNVHEVTNGFVYRDSLMLVRAFEVPHGQWAHAFGYRFEAGNRAIVVSGDTRASDSVVTACHGCDVLFHEVYSSSRFLNQTPAWQKYLLSAHTSTKELAALATAAQPKLLVLYHQLYEGAIDDSLLVREIRDGGFHGTVVSAKDLGVYR
jgi:ribonuclease BN (tRNA processing enzyme)